MTTVFPTAFAAQTAPLLANLDANFTNVAGALVIPCTPIGSTGTLVVLTPAQASSGLVITGYTNKPIFSFICLVTATGPVSVNVSNNGALPLYASDGVTQITTGGLVANAIYIIQLDNALNSGAGGFAILSSSPNGVATGTFSNPTVTVGADGRITNISSGVPTVGSGYFKQLRVNNNGSTPNSQINVSAAVVVAATSSFTNAVALTNLSATINLAVGTSVSQANGMDGEAPLASAPLYIYAISTASGPAGLASLSTLVPNLPPGVTQFTRVGAMCLDSSSNIFRTMQIGPRVSYTLTSGTNTTSLPLLASGTVGSVNTPTYVAVSLNSFVPSTARVVFGTANGDAGAGIEILIAPNANYGPFVSTISPPALSINNGGTAGGGQMFGLELESQMIYWATSGSAHLWAIGWEDNLP